MTIDIPEKPSLDELAHYGVKGMRWGVRKKLDIERKKFTKEEILAARAAQAKRAERTQKATDATTYNPETGRLKYTREIDDARRDWSNSVDRYVANRKTRGEKVAATLLAGPVGAYLTSDLRTKTRAANERPTKYKSMRKYKKEYYKSLEREGR